MQETISQVLSFSNEGVHFDTFNPKKQPVPCVCCKMGREWVAYSTESQLVLQHVTTQEKHVHSIPDIKSIEGLVGCTACVITKSQAMYIVQKGKVLHKCESVKSAFQGKDYVVYVQEIEDSEEAGQKNLAEGSEKRAPEEGAKKPQAGGAAEKKGASPGSAGKAQEKASEEKVKSAEAGAGKKGGKPGKPAPAVMNIQKKEGMQAAVVNKAKPKLLKAYSVAEKREIEEVRMPAPLVFSVTNKFLVTVRAYRSSKGDIEIIRLSNGEKVKKQAVLNMISASLIVDTKYGEERLLCLCSLNSTNGTYYDTKALYYIDTESGAFKLVPGICNPITDTAFLKKGEFAVCYDNSPSKIAIFNRKGEKTKSLKDGVHNKMFFNRQETIACFAGMNNLPGNMSIFEYPSEAALSLNEEVGCSVVDWSPNGTFYLVGITNKMSIDNKVSLYDYYSRKIAEVSFRELKACMFAGKDEGFVPVKTPPAKVQIKKAAAYIPPCLRKDAAKGEAEWAPAHVIKDKAKARESKMEAIKKELLEIEKIEQQMSKGQVVPGGIVKIQRKEALLKKLNKKKGAAS
ncbi:translation initiation factor 2A [Nematocida major]|uniref:translation initiation factor 2A n=1 Tax=Nematocida major TaxID=1912982 RepID=UPI002007FEC4|nr:translation initiation factor 2A [Nematocida major]KAH9385455.1 translation initiation factor 2A [Nematocida major]